MKTSDFDQAFDDGLVIDDVLDWSKARRISNRTFRINLELPATVVDRLDREATRKGITRQSLISSVLDDHLESADSTTHSGHAKSTNVS